MRLSLGVKEVLGLDEAVIRERFHLSGNEGMVLEYVGAVTEDVRWRSFPLHQPQFAIARASSRQVSSLVETKKRPYDLLEVFKSHPAVAPLGARREATRILGAPDPREPAGR